MVSLGGLNFPRAGWSNTNITFLDTERKPRSFSEGSSVSSDNLGSVERRPRAKSFSTALDRFLLWNEANNTSKRDRDSDGSLDIPDFPIPIPTLPTSPKKEQVVYRKPRNVSFANHVMVILIPTKTEFKIAGLATDIWYQSYDYEDFKRSAAAEIRNYIDSQLPKENTSFNKPATGLDVKRAMSVLYQPSFNESSILSL